MEQRRIVIRTLYCACVIHCPSDFRAGYVRARADMYSPYRVIIVEYGGVYIFGLGRDWHLCGLQT